MRINRKQSRTPVWMLLLSLVVLGTSALAQNSIDTAAFPARPLKLFVGANPGGNIDVTARIVGKRLADVLGRPIIVENRPGAGGAVAFNAVRQAVGDPYTLLMVPTGFTTGPALKPNVGYDPVRDFTPISTVSYFSYAIAVAAQSPHRTLADLLAAAKARPDTIEYGTGGVGSGQHLVAELLAAVTGSKFVHVPYRGGAGPVQDLISGQIPMIVEIVSILAPHAQAGSIRVLAVTGPVRSPMLPGVPTMQEAGIADFVVQGWLGVVAPAGIPAVIADKLNVALRRTLGDAATAAGSREGRGGAAREQRPGIRCLDRKRDETLEQSRARCEYSGAMSVGRDRSMTPRGIAASPHLASSGAALDAAIGEIKAALGERASTSAALRERHGQDESYHPPSPPDAVAFPDTTAEVSRIAAICSRYRVPMIPFGAGTSLEGNVAALHGGVSIDLTGMNRILEVNTDDMDMRVEAGVTRKQLNNQLKDTGLFFPIDPGADATIGGMAATRASGTTTVRYGTMRDNVLGLTVVLSDGRIIRTGSRARKSAAGYDLTHLFVGAEGTLGIITEIQLRLHSVPPAITSAVCAFPTLDNAVNTVIQTIHMGIPVARIELLDELEMRAVNLFSKLSYPERPTLFFEFHGSEAGATEQAEMVGEIARDQGASEFQWANRPEDRNRLWQARHDALYAARALRPGAKVMITDVCVPISKLARCILETRADIDASGLIAPIVGHVGDGNFHVLIIVMPDDPAEVTRATALNDRLVARALDAGGTCTGEHGVGYGKIRYLEGEQSSAIGTMIAIKKSLDPFNLMNPGKIFRSAREPTAD